MSDPTELLDYLKKRNIPFKIHPHSPTVTAMETAAAEHVSGKCFAKSVVVKTDQDLILAVLPAHLQVDIDRLAALSKRTSVRLAEEAEFASLFPNCDVGAMPPFGKLYSLEVFIDDDIAVAPEVTFNACSHDQTVTISGKDFLKAAEGVVGDFSKEMHG